MVRAHVLLLESLSIKKLEAVIGFSMGGQLAYHWGALHPGMLEFSLFLPRYLIKLQSKTHPRDPNQDIVFCRNGRKNYRYLFFCQNFNS